MERIGKVRVLRGWGRPADGPTRNYYRDLFAPTSLRLEGGTRIRQMNRENSKSEARNTKQYQMTKISMLQTISYCLSSTLFQFRQCMFCKDKALSASAGIVKTYIVMPGLTGHPGSRMGNSLLMRIIKDLNGMGSKSAHPTKILIFY